MPIPGPISKIRAAMRLFPLLLVAMLAACNAGPSNLIGVAEEQLLAVDTTGISSHTIYLATTRTRSTQPDEFFSGERSSNLGLGNVTVTIPPNHKTGKIERPTGVSDPTKHFTIRNPEIYENPEAFAASLDLALAEKPESGREVLVFVHGYNTNFSEAVLRVSQFVHDTGFKGIPILFSWASRGNTMDYVYDINSALQARYYLEELAVRLSSVNVNAFTLVAHSMGNLVTLEAMSGLARRANMRRPEKLRAVILAAPDVDYDLFVEHMKDLQPIKDKFFVFVSKDDKALSLSQKIAGGVARVGSTDPQRLAALGLKVVDLSEIDDASSANHTKFADSPAIVQLIGRGLNRGHSLTASREERGTVRSVTGQVVQTFRKIPAAAASGNGSVLTVGN